MNVASRFYDKLYVRWSVVVNCSADSVAVGGGGLTIVSGQWDSLVNSNLVPVMSRFTIYNSSHSDILHGLSSVPSENCPIIHVV